MTDLQLRSAVSASKTSTPERSLKTEIKSVGPIADRLIDSLASTRLGGWLGDRFFAIIGIPAAREALRQQELEQAHERVLRAIGMRAAAIEGGFAPATGNEAFRVDVAPYSYHGAKAYNILLNRQTSVQANQESIKPRDSELVITIDLEQETLFIKEGQPVNFRTDGACVILGYAADALEASTRLASRTS